MASSEEIAAALRDAIECMEGATDRTYTAALLAARTATLRAHLSRLREEAEFRDAALRFCAEDFAEFHPKEVPDAADRSPYARNARLWFAYRALEEPRDG